MGQKGKINFGGLILIILIIYVLFKIDIKDSTENPKFKKNLSFIKEYILGIKDKFFIETKLIDTFKNMTNKNFAEDYIFDTKTLNLISSVDIQNLEGKFTMPKNTTNNFYNTTNDINKSVVEPFFSDQ